MSNTTVAGTDGIVPVYDPNARWCYWSINEIYTGTIGKGKYIPKVNDYVIDPDTFVTYIVASLDELTLIPRLVIKRPNIADNALSETDILFGVGPGTQSDTYRVYVDKSVIPFVLEVDARLKVAGSMSNFAKIYLGVDCSSASGKVISRVYDSSGNFVTENVPLELVAIDSHVNYSIKRIGTCHTNVNLNDGEVVTVVIFSSDGHVISKRQLLVENTSFIRQVNDGKKYITSINLECPFISPTQADIIEYPLNVPIDAINLMGVVNYSDGSKLKLPVNGGKFVIHGLEQYVSTIVGQKMNLVLAYLLDTDEAVYGSVSSDNKYVSAPYTLRTINPNNSYTVKVYGYPVWVNQANGYIMKWFLYNLDRNVWFDVTPYVEFAENTGAFNPKGYGYLQEKAIQINLEDVSGAFKPYIHTEVVEIILNGIPSADSTPWTVRNAASSSDIKFGKDLFAERKSATEPKVNLSSGFTTKEEWLNNFYTKTYPLINPVFEEEPPVPTTFIVSYKNVETVCSIDDWNSDITLNSIPDLGSTLFIRFVKETPTNDIQLSIAAVMILK